MKYTTFLKVTALLILCAALSGCSREASQAAPNAASEPAVESVPDRNVITVANPERFSLAPAVERHESDQILANGVVAADVSRSHPVNSLSSGRVVEVRARLGDDVQKGQILLTMTSPDMSQAFSDYQKFQAVASLAKTQLDRAQLLYSHGAVPQKDVEVAEDAYRRANIDTRPPRSTFVFSAETRSISRRRLKSTHPSRAPSSSRTSLPRLESNRWTIRRICSPSRICPRSGFYATFSRTIWRAFIWTTGPKSS